MDAQSSGLDIDDPQLEEKLVAELKSQGIFDQIRKDCLADVDTTVGAILFSLLLTFKLVCVLTPCNRKEAITFITSFFIGTISALNM
jgi:hypothetical protein